MRQPQLLEDAQWLRGRPHHRSIHPGGICICDQPIQRIAAVERAAKGIVVTQLDMYSIEQTGLIKIDLLGNRCVSEIGTVRDLIEERTGKRPRIDAIPERCEKTAELLCRGETLGCFQLESPAMRSLLMQMQARNAQNTIQAVALIRPGPASGGLKESFCRRVRGQEPPTAPHPCLNELLIDQQGLLLYEENVMEAIALVTGKSLARADLMRRSMLKAIRSNDDEQLRRLGDEFIAEGIGNGFGATDARELWQYVMRPLQRRLVEAGFDGVAWQAGLGNPVAANNFMLERCGSDTLRSCPTMGDLEPPRNRACIRFEGATARRRSAV